jgi:hypothetical protein
MIYYHPTTKAWHGEYLKTGFVSEKTLEKMLSRFGYLPREYDRHASCQIVACDTPENALQYGRNYYGPRQEIVILAIEGDFIFHPLAGTQVPDNTVMLHGEISPAQISIWENEPTLSLTP